MFERIAIVARWKHVHYALGLIARSWGYFQQNLRAGQDEKKVEQISKVIKMIFPTCGVPSRRTLVVYLSAAIVE